MNDYILKQKRFRWLDIKGYKQTKSLQKKSK